MATYSFLDVQASLSGPGGTISIGSDAGVSEEGITVEPTEDKDTQTIGADGSVMHSLHAGKPGRITVRLLQTSKVNAKLAALYNLQTQNAALHGQNVLVVTDTQRGDVLSGRSVAFARYPTVTRGKDGVMQEWVFNVGKLHMLLGTGVPDVNT